MKEGQAQIDNWVEYLADEAQVLFKDLNNINRVNIAEVTTGMVRAAVRLTCEYAPDDQIPEALEMLIRFMGSEMQECLAKENPEPIEH